MTTAEVQQNDWPWWLVLIEGIALAILGALLLFWNTAATWTTLVWILGIYWIIIGIVKLISMFQDHSKWGWKLVLGVLYIIAGLFLVGSPLYGGIVFGYAVILVIGIYAIILGIISLIAAFKGAGWGAGILGAITVILGIWLLMNPGASTLALPWTVGILSLIGGVYLIYMAFKLK